MSLSSINESTKNWGALTSISDSSTSEPAKWMLPDVTPARSTERKWRRRNRMAIGYSKPVSLLEERASKRASERVSVPGQLATVGVKQSKSRQTQERPSHAPLMMTPAVPCTVLERMT